ncbi:MAG: MotA/TolQ/ExbB proton channel family protein [Kiritimatiellae bacterium]|nr:MotA/TolQ/ExbB proton channel family protein [Kiritimatiellia bacterium]
MELNMILSQGGIILWLIMATGLLSMIIFVERYVHLHRARLNVEGFTLGAFTVLKRGNKEEAMAICSKSPGPIAYIVKTIIEHSDQSKEDLRVLAEEASQSEISRMERRLIVIMSIAQLTPLLGLLGTFLGIFKYLLVISPELPLVQSADYMTGLYYALITTIAGLMVALPSYAALNLLSLKIDRVVIDMERAASETISFFQKNGTQNNDND